MDKTTILTIISYFWFFCMGVMAHKLKRWMDDELPTKRRYVKGGKKPPMPKHIF